LGTRPFGGHARNKDARTGRNCLARAGQSLEDLFRKAKDSFSLTLQTTPGIKETTEETAKRSHAIADVEPISKGSYQHQSIAETSNNPQPKSVHDVVGIVARNRLARGTAPVLTGHLVQHPLRLQKLY
jgi:hypothetical protein